jgi:hypothetical protein
LISALLAKDPEQRPGAEEVEAVLEAVAEGWPVPEVAARGSGTEPQDVSHLREFGDDAGTVRLGAASGVVRESEPEPSAEPATTAPHPAPTARRPALRRRAALAAAAVLLVGGTWFAASYFGDTENSAATEQTATLTEAPAREGSAPPSTAGWTAHRQPGMDAVLYLPRRYRMLYQTDGSSHATGLSVYNDGTDETIAVTFIGWGKAPSAPLAEAKENVIGMEGHKRTKGQYTATTFDGDKAVLSDVTYDPHDKPVRVLQLVVRTSDDRMYQLQVQMPKGTPDEKRGTALFKGARDRLVIGKS